jgi:rod shape determining protein RodA
MAHVDISLPPQARLMAAERSPARHVDVGLVLATLALCGFGLLMVYSATRGSLSALNEDPGLYLKRQALFLVIGLGMMLVASVIDYRLIKLYTPFLYGLSVLTLLLVQTPLGTSVKGAQRWFQIGAFQLSPSLFSRLALVAMLAAFLAGMKGEFTLRQVIRATTLAVIPVALVFIQPDIGTSIVIAFILVALLVVSGAKFKHLAVLALVAGIALFGAFQLHIIKDYQIDRLTSFLDPSADALAAGYNRQQAEIAIGAGGLFGVGYLQGTQTNLDFVPEQHTDFIFTAVGEELGFLRGGVPLLLLFGLLIWRILRVAQMSADPFGTFLAVGVASFIAIQLFVNVGMTIGIMPITGIPLPFLSYGGSALIADLIGIGLVQNVHMRRFA